MRREASFSILFVILSLRSTTLSSQRKGFVWWLEQFGGEVMRPWSSLIGKVFWTQLV